MSLTLALFSFLLFIGVVHSIPAHPPEARDSPTGLCGASNGELQCITGNLNQCCSQYGWCGDSSDHCGVGCQTAYGRCNGSPIPPSTRPWLGSVPYGEGIYTCQAPGTIALTYDDGPYLWTSQLLDILDNYGIKATFFITARNLNKGPLDDPNLPWAAVLRRMYRSGHQIAGHSMDHRDLDAISESDRRLQMTGLESVLQIIIGRYPTYMRPPYSRCGAACLSTMNAMGYHVVFWDLNTDDYNNDSPLLIQRSKDIVTGAINGADPRYRGFISIAHDIHSQTVVNLTMHEIDVGRNRGFRFVTLGECLNDPQDNWYRIDT